jgi:nicotinamidase-related amidase
MSDQYRSSASVGALLVMDLQPSVLSLYGGDASKLLSNTEQSIGVARSMGLRVIFVRVAFRIGHSEVSGRNKMFSGLIGTEFLVDGSPGSEIDPKIKPDVTDVIVTKHRVSAFYETDLDQVLRAQGIERLCLAGYATSGVVLSTVRDAADRDYKIMILGNCVADNNPSLQRTLLENVFPSQATVVDSLNPSDSFFE